MSVKIPRPPRIDLLFSQDAQGRLVLNQGVMRDLRIYLENMGKAFEQHSGAIPWSTITFVGSKLTDIETRRHADLQVIEQVDPTDTSSDRTKHLSNSLAKGWEDHRALTTSAHGGIVADTDARLTDARTPLAHGNEKHTAAFEDSANKNAAGGYAGLNASSRTTKGVDTTDDVIVDDTTKGIVLKDAQATPHYWKVGVTTSGVLTTTDLGTVKP